MSRRLDRTLVKRMAWYSILCTFLVPYVHLPEFASRYDSNPLLRFVLTTWEKGVCRIPVEAFFVLSGYLFFRTYQADGSSYWSKLKRRIQTLIVPYVLWVSLGFLYELVTGDRTLTLGSLLDGFGLTADHPAIVSLWYIRNLMILCVVSPVLYWAIQRKRIGVVFLGALFMIQWFELPGELQPLQNAFWFAAGGYIVSHYTQLVKQHLPRPWLWLMSWLGLVFLAQLLIAAWGLSLTRLEPLYVVTGIPVVWSLTAALDQPLLLRYLAPHTFLVFCLHGALNDQLSTLWLRRLPQTDRWLTLGYMIIPLASMAFSVLVGEIGRVRLPRLYAAMTGGRGLRVPQSEVPAVDAAIRDQPAPARR